MPRIQPYKDEAGEFRWRRIADNGDIIATSGEGYKNKRHAIDMAAKQFPDDEFDWDVLPNPDALIDDGVSDPDDVGSTSTHNPDAEDDPMNGDTHVF